VTIVLSVALLGERTHRVAVAGVLAALAAIVLLSIQRPDDGRADRELRGLAGTLGILLMWGVQAYFTKSAGAIGERACSYTWPHPASSSARSPCR
jgi:drug/metabolite transporter (DMT)-like permease